MLRRARIWHKYFMIATCDLPRGPNCMCLKNRGYSVTPGRNGLSPPLTLSYTMWRNYLAHFLGGISIFLFWSGQRSSGFQDIAPICCLLLDTYRSSTPCNSWSSDASSYGLGATLLHQHDDLVPVAYACESLNNTQHYGQIEKD